MKKLYIDGLIVSVENYITSVNFHKLEINGNVNELIGNFDDLPDEVKSSINRTFKCRVFYNIDDRIVNVYYREGLTIRDLCNYCKRWFTHDLPNNEDKEITINAKTIPDKTLTINGIEYIKTPYTDFDTINQYLYHYNYDRKIVDNSIVKYNNGLHIFLVDSIYNDYTMHDYVSYINSIDKGIHALILDRTKFAITNIYNRVFDNSINNYIDKSQSYSTDELYVNDVIVSADFVRQMRELYPEIQFYTREEDRDSTKYNEWINYNIHPSKIKSEFHTSHVWLHPVYGRIWRTGLEIELEYASQDLPTLLARRDSFRIGSFINKHDKFVYRVKGENGEDVVMKYCILWNRDNLETEYGKQTTQDDTGYSIFTYKYTGILTFTNLEHAATKVNRVEKVLFNLAYPNKNTTHIQVTKDTDNGMQYILDKVDNKSIMQDNEKGWFDKSSVDAPFDDLKSEEIKISDSLNTDNGVLTKTFKLGNKETKLETHSEDDLGVIL